MAVRGDAARRAALREQASPFAGKPPKAAKAGPSAVDSTNSTFELSTFLGHWHQFYPHGFTSAAAINHILHIHGHEDHQGIALTWFDCSDKGYGQHLLKNPAILDAIIEKVRPRTTRTTLLDRNTSKEASRRHKP